MGGGWKPDPGIAYGYQVLDDAIWHSSLFEKEA